MPDTPRPAADQPTPAQSIQATEPVAAVPAAAPEQASKEAATVSAKDAPDASKVGPDNQTILLNICHQMSGRTSCTSIWRLPLSACDVVQRYA